jgi:putative membrane protein
VRFCVFIREEFINPFFLFVFLMIGLIAAIFIGVLFGIFAGLVPGIHVNLVSLMAVSLSPVLLHYFSLLSISCFIVSMCVVQSFLNIIPAVYLGAPDSDSCLGVLPGHRFLLKGDGFLAVKLNLVGSLSGLVLSIVFLPVAVFIVKSFYPLISGYVGWLILAVVLYMIWRDKSPFWAFVVFSLSGFLGFLVLNSHNLENPLLPLLSGLFGVSTLIYSFNSGSHIPRQNLRKRVFVKKWAACKAVFSSFVAGFFASVLPGLGSSQGAVLAKQVAGNIGEKGFMILLGGVNTVNFALSLASLYALGKARNGAVVALGRLLGEVSLFQICIFAGVALVGGAVSVLLALFFGRVFSRLVESVNYKLLVSGVVCVVLFLVVILSGWKGIVVLFASASLGVIASIVKCSRTQAMGCLLVPVMIYFITA